MVRCDKCCTTTSLGRPRKPCPATTSPPMMCLTASASHTGHGTDSRYKSPRLNLHHTGIGPCFEPVRQLHIDHCGGSTLPTATVLQSETSPVSLSLGEHRRRFFA